MGTTPVTQAQWKAVMGENPSYFSGDNHPVECLSWHDCQAFCERLREKTDQAVRLPTEAEWEYACRAGTTTEYYSGDGEPALSRVGWYKNKSGTEAVGRKAPNAWGLYDMHGNVYEWCESCWSPYRKHAAIDPQSTAADDRRILRGGAWGRYAHECRSASRYMYKPKDWNFSMGCRVCFS